MEYMIALAQACKLTRKFNKVAAELAAAKIPIAPEALVERFLSVDRFIVRDGKVLLNRLFTTATGIESTNQILRDALDPASANSFIKFVADLKALTQTKNP